MRVMDVMTNNPITVGLDTPFKEIVNVLVERDIGGVPVVDSDGQLVGIVTESDLLTKPAYGHEHPGVLSLIGSLFSQRHHAWLTKASALTARDVMSRRVRTAAPSEDVEVVSRRLLEHRIGRLPVVEDSRLVGIISRRDLLRQFHRTDEEISAEVAALVEDPVSAEGFEVTFSVNEGVVTLSGTVPFPRDVAVVEDVVARIPGVVSVEISVTAREPEPKLEPPAPYA